MIDYRQAYAALAECITNYAHAAPDERMQWLARAFTVIWETTQMEVRK